MKAAVKTANKEEAQIAVILAAPEPEALVEVAAPAELEVEEEPVGVVEEPVWVAAELAGVETTCQVPEVGAAVGETAVAEKALQYWINLFCSLDK